ncbi:hypothetical protein HDV00_011590 [Rhizophlyctis rosea]|nr:hypothetical protein HDV00_011590 [Rhizophlyctis rosea]
MLSQEADAACQNEALRAIQKVHHQTQNSVRQNRDVVDFNEGYCGVQRYIVQYLAQRGRDGVTEDSQADVTDFLMNHVKKWLKNSDTTSYVRQNGSKSPIELNKEGWEEMLRIAIVKVDNGVVRLFKRRGLN